MLQALIKKAWNEQRRTHDYLSRMAITYNTLLLENTELYNVITTNPGKDRIGWYLSLLCEIMANSRGEVFLKIKEKFLSEITNLSEEECHKSYVSFGMSASLTYTLADARFRDEEQRRSLKTEKDMESDEFDCLSMKNTAAALYYGSIMLGNDSYLVKNDFAYMLRRKEVNQPYGLTVEDILKDSIKAKKAFPLVNMALHYAMNRCSKEDWSQADELLAMIAEDEVKSIESYWTGMANWDEDEGFLVLLWLCRHGFIETTKYGDQERLFTLLKARVDTIPNWMKEKAFIKNSTEIY
ncbi:hypothetical protein [Anaerotignum propionicum]|uniref:Uncharacterized protein n=1 Tax=Anaerotignum propionicum DSM 1682 TaxID=991789 RepID=A0A0X1U7J3_ANAPI|nr:hypothetical protein [Anaerotignum propionicum]AMJ40916.1 hypothetical protein CPRO_13230 [Anaerotignum propionicum DSM 1682]SHE76308.1 hypothetical protein SAMN02745151_01735 [[Clostridium] propionicum DSM 1682] [Anaerotignum propionicum DSM 1682]